MATWLRRMFRPDRRIDRSAAARDTDAARAMQTALAEAEEWAAHAAALARVFKVPFDPDVHGRVAAEDVRPMPVRIHASSRYSRRPAEGGRCRSAIPQ